MNKKYDWLPTGEFPDRPGPEVVRGLVALAQSTKTKDHEDLLEIGISKGKAEVRFALEAVSLQRDAARAREFRVLQWLVAAVALATFVATALQAVAALGSSSTSLG